MSGYMNSLSAISTSALNRSLKSRRCNICAAVICALNRNTSISYPTSGLNVTFTYDGAGTAYGKGRLTQMVDGSGTTNYTAYERRGLLITEQKILDSTTYTTQYAYNKNSAVTSMTYPSGRTVSYSINLTKGRPQTIAAPVSGTNTNLLSSINYYPFGPVSAATFSNGRTLGRTFDAKYRILTNTVSSSILSLSYDYATGSCQESESNIRCINDNVTPANNKTFTYDDRYQVLNTTGPWGTENYTYDRNGNRRSKVTNGTKTTYSYTTGTNRLSSTAGGEPANYGYDANGNITSDGSGTFIYGDHNRLYAILHNAGYAYDGRNLRIRKSYLTGSPIFLPPPFWLYFFDQQGKLIAEKNGVTGKFQDYIYLENEVIARIDNNAPNNDTLSLYHDDHLGTPVALSNSSGTVVLRTEYFAFGKVYSQSGSATNNVRFPGQYFDSESTLHQNWWRDYDPKIGRYRELDPVRSARRNEGLNLYWYVSNNSLILSDFTGQVATGFVAGDVVCRKNPGFGTWADVILFVSSDQICVWGQFPPSQPCGTAKCGVKYQGPEDPYANRQLTVTKRVASFVWTPNRIKRCFEEWKKIQPPYGPCYGKDIDCSQCTDFIGTLIDCKKRCKTTLKDICGN